MNCIQRELLVLVGTQNGNLTKDGTMTDSKNTAFALSLILILAACGDEGQGAGSGVNDGQGSSDSDNPNTVGTGSLTECFNPVLYQDGTSYTVVDEIIGKVTPITGESTTMTSVTTSIEWNGVSYTRLVRETSTNFSFKPTSSESSITDYVSIDFTNMIREQAGFVSVDFDDDTGAIETTTTEVYTPPTSVDFDMNAGETHTETVQVERTYDQDSGTIDEVENQTRSVRFMGIEPVTVPAGTVDACRMEFDNIKGGDTEAGTSWIHKGSGIPVRMIVDGVIEYNLKSAVLNGASVF
jgi:hypothetical protein